MVRKLINLIKWILFEQPSLARLTLNTALKNALPELKPGKILEIGAGIHNSSIEDLKGEFDYVSLNLLFSEKPEIVADACAMPLPDNSLESIIILEVLEHVPAGDILISECLRVLKNEGIIIGSTRFIHPEHGAPHDYYRFTEESLRILLSDFSERKIEKLGNRFHVLVDIITENYSFLKILNRILQHIRLKPSTCYLGFLFVAKK
jgi:SAM-dependent methyltransferase